MRSCTAPATPRHGADYASAVRIAVALLVATLALAGCGGSSHGAATTTAPVGPAAAVGSGAKTLYRSTNGWAVVQQGSKAVALHLVGGTWRPDRTGTVHVRILGPQRSAARQPQVAAEISAPNDLAETALWVDGEELLEKGGGTPRNGTIYGTTAAPLAPGPHVAVAYGRTATAATAVAWTFRVV
jgi:hypothetical protein